MSRPPYRRPQQLQLQRYLWQIKLRLLLRQLRPRRPRECERPPAQVLPSPLLQRLRQRLHCHPQLGPLRQSSHPADRAALPRQVLHCRRPQTGSCHRNRHVNLCCSPTAWLRIPALLEYKRHQAPLLPLQSVLVSACRPPMELWAQQLMLEISRHHSPGAPVSARRDHSRWHLCRPLRPRPKCQPNSGTSGAKWTVRGERQ